MAKHSSNQAVGINYIKHTKQAPKQSNFIFEPKYTPFCTMNLITFPSRKKIFKVTETLTKQTKQGKMKNPLHLFPTPQLQKQQFKVFRKKQQQQKKKQKTANNNSLFSLLKIDNMLLLSMQIQAHQTLGSSLLSSGSLSSPKAQPTAVSRHPNIPLAMTNIQSNSTGKDLKSDPWTEKCFFVLNVSDLFVCHLLLITLNNVDCTKQCCWWNVDNLG